MSDSKEERLTQQPAYFQLYQAYKDQTIYGSIYYRQMPENVVGVKEIENSMFHQWCVNVEPCWEHGNLLSLETCIHERLKQLEEVIAGLYLVDNDEFNLIYKHFIREFFFMDVWVGYSPKLTEMEKYGWEKAGDDKIDYEDCIFESNFRLFRRYREGKKIKYTSLITNISGYEINTDETPLIKASFNNGSNFFRFYKIYLALETGLQLYNRLFFIGGKKLLLTAVDQKTINEETQQMYSPSGYFQPMGEDISEMNTWEPFEACTMEEVRLAYNTVMDYYNDQMTELGFGGDDSNKCERLTTGENFRSLQPNSTFQSSVLRMLDEFSYKVFKTFNTSVAFNLAFNVNMQGVPVLEESGGNDESNINKGNNKKDNRQMS